MFINRNPEKNEDKIMNPKFPSIMAGNHHRLHSGGCYWFAFRQIGLMNYSLIQQRLRIALIVGGVMFIVVESIHQRQRRQNIQSIEDVPRSPIVQALLVGFWQVLALIPGMSRSGMSIIGGMLSGLDRQRATQFSFYLAMPTLGAATLYTLIKDLDSISGK